MQREEKIKKTEGLIVKLKNIATRAIKKHNYEKALAAISSCADVLYQYNQRYKDDELEDMLIQIGNEVITIPDNQPGKADKKVQTVLFYDGFGLDLRGLAIQSTRAIVQNGYKLIYVTKKTAEGKQPNLMHEISAYQTAVIYIDTDTSYINWVDQLNKVFIKYSPEVAFFYTTPFDVSGVIVFNRYEGYTTRFLSDLTDHAFWLGIHSFDYILNNRNLGQSIQYYYRGIPISKMLRTRGSLYVNESIEMKPLPFNINEYRYVFGGGDLYKTLGDPKNTYYRMIEYIVQKYEDVNFIYAGKGDPTEFNKLINKYPGRIYLFPERIDYYQLMKGCVFYLNTYPMFGGMMMRYACNAGKVPLTLKHNHDADGILYAQEKLNIEFDNYDEMLLEIDRLLCNTEYRKKKEAGLSLANFTQKQAADLYHEMFEDHHSPFKVEIEDVDTKQFRSEYIERMNYSNIRRNAIAKKINKTLICCFPDAFIDRLIRRMVKQ